MISCDSFRTRFHAGTEDAALLAHLRTCDRCLDFAANEDPDVMFRALGGDEMIPPGGIISSPPRARNITSGSSFAAKSRQRSHVRMCASSAASSVFA